MPAGGRKARLGGEGRPKSWEKHKNHLIWFMYSELLYYEGER